MYSKLSITSKRYLEIQQTKFKCKVYFQNKSSFRFKFYCSKYFFKFSFTRENTYVSIPRQRYCRPVPREQIHLLRQLLSGQFLCFPCRLLTTKEKSITTSMFMMWQERREKLNSPDISNREFLRLRMLCSWSYTYSQLAHVCVLKKGRG